MSEPLLEARGLSKSYLSGTVRLEVLSDLQVSVPAGEMLAIVGASGVGKSTLLHLLGTIDVPDHGTVRFEGQDVFRMTEPERTRLRNRAIGFVFQFHHLLPEFTALENVMMPLRIGREPEDEAAARARELLGVLGLSDRLEHRPAQLSGGEQQRVAVARALVVGPRLLLADEPTGNLDPHTSDELVQVFRRLHMERGLTSILVTHSEKIAAVCERVLLMEEGRLKPI